MFYAEPENESEPLKSIPDEESIEAKWMTLEEIEGMKEKLRGYEILDWAKYLENKGPIYPLNIFTLEIDPVNQ